MDTESVARRIYLAHSPHGAPTPQSHNASPIYIILLMSALSLRCIIFLYHAPPWARCDGVLPPQCVKYRMEFLSHGAPTPHIPQGTTYIQSTSWVIG